MVPPGTGMTVLLGLGRAVRPGLMTQPFLPHSNSRRVVLLLTPGNPDSCGIGPR